MDRLPSWANWLARDKDGELWAYECEPERVGLQWFGEEGIQVWLFDKSGEWDKIVWEDEYPFDLKSETLVKDSVIQPSHYRDKHGKDLMQRWYEKHDFETFRHIMRALAERYTERYEKKNGAEDLEKGIETLRRLKEYEIENETIDQEG